MEKETQYFKQVDPLLAEMAKVEKSSILSLLNVELKDARIKLSLTITFLNILELNTTNNKIFKRSRLN